VSTSEERAVAQTSSQISSVEITDDDTLQAGYQAPTASRNFFVGVWAGPQARGEPLAIAPAPSSAGAVSLTVPKINFREGPFTVGLTATTPGPAVCSSVLLVNGQEALSVQTSLRVIAYYPFVENGIETGLLWATYRLPDGTDPLLNLASLSLFRGAGPAFLTPDHLMRTVPVRSNHNSGLVRIDVVPPLARDTAYSVAYSPSAAAPVFTAYFSFRLPSRAAGLEPL